VVVVVALTPGDVVVVVGTLVVGVPAPDARVVVVAEAPVVVVGLVSRVAVVAVVAGGLVVGVVVVVGGTVVVVVVVVVVGGTPENVPVLVVQVPSLQVMMVAVLAGGYR
jgi:hypothetical protein